MRTTIAIRDRIYKAVNSPDTVGINPVFVGMLLDDLYEAMAALSSIEWILPCDGPEDCHHACPVCEHPQAKGHSEECVIGRVLGRTGHHW